MSNRTDQRGYIIIGTLLFIISLTLIGATKQFYIPKSIPLVYIGLIIGFGAMAIAFIPIYNELIRIATEIDKNNGVTNDSE